MATDITSISKAAQEQILSAITASQDAIVEGVRTMSASMAGVASAMPAIPGMDQLPKPAETLELGFGFAERLLASQREFAEKLLGATAPAAKASAPKG